MSGRGYVALVATWVAAAILAIGWSLAPRGGVPADGEPVQALPVPDPGVAASFETEDTLPSALAGVAVEPVTGRWVGPGGRPFHVALRSRSEGTYRSRQFGRAVFDLTLRTDVAGVSQEPCTSCHAGQGPVSDRPASASAGVHANVRPVHPEQTGALCTTCHDANDPGRLRLERGGSVALDHAYELCAQCHYRQVESWAFGAHGKRLVGWRGRRVVMGCADCHDPHRPATVPRLPMAGPTLPGPLLTESDGEGHGGAGSHEEPAGRHP